MKQLDFNEQLFLVVKTDEDFNFKPSPKNVIWRKFNEVSISFYDKQNRISNHWFGYPVVNPEILKNGNFLFYGEKVGIAGETSIKWKITKAYPFKFKLKF